jgi:hypothetical protein
LKQLVFERGDALEEFVDGQKRRTTSEPHESHFKRRAWLTTTNDVVEASRKTLVQTRQIIGIGSFRESQNIGGFAIGQIEKSCGILGNFGDDEVTQVSDEITRDVGQIVTLLG